MQGRNLQLNDGLHSVLAGEKRAGERGMGGGRALGGLLMGLKGRRWFQSVLRLHFVRSNQLPMQSGWQESSGDLILVTGASGFVGSAVATAFRQLGYRVRVLVRPSSPKTNIDARDDVC